MRNVMMLAVAAGLVLPTVASARPVSENPEQARAELRAQAHTNARVDRAATWQDRSATRQEQRDDRRDQREDTRNARRDVRQDARQDARRDAYRDARQEARQDSRRDVRQDARRDYRRENRRQYRDWRAYRQAERQAFRRGAYYAPRGYSYRRVGAGQSLFANVFWGQRYWVDPYEYYLPQPRFYHERWIRYGNDVLLIDTRNGRVLTVYDNFFW